MKNNETLRLLYTSKSVRAFTDQPIDEADVQAVLRAACMAPTAGNQQLYTILRITDHSLLSELAEACDHQRFIAAGKLVLVFCADCLKWYDAYADCGLVPRESGPGDLLLAVDDALIAAQNAVIAAGALGIGSCYIGDIMENMETVRELLQLPERVFPAALLVFGYPTQQQIQRPKPERVDTHYIVHENRYHRLEAEELREMLGIKAPKGQYGEWVAAFYRRKYASDFAREMNRSVAAYLAQYGLCGRGEKE
ncbi:MAG: nitroreductase family protein [Clostridia bacterium]|nr:nitroreductase family protein [Clostridia bacterium]